MSEENVQIVVEALEAWNAGDLDRTLATIHPDVVWRPSGAIPDLKEEYRGLDGVLQFWNGWREVWEKLVIVPQRVIDKGDAVLVDALFEGTGRGGVQVSTRFGQVYTLRDGKLIRFESFTSWDEAERASDLAAVAARAAE